MGILRLPSLIANTKHFTKLQSLCNRNHSDVSEGNPHLEDILIILKENPTSKDFGHFGIWALYFGYLDYIKVLEIDLGIILAE
ncbi:hypothetical protein L6452_15870 [Arctium lappa]|uniref:Uncharacterized protein n=1 Tax=Arctium lappa TaxID=4217 RepID=A0ACB9CQ21_ARCLA|nr:hypothetical protein L6452_15870 [Arctium lappa]